MNRAIASAKYLKALTLKLSLYILVVKNALRAIEFQVIMDEGKAVMNDKQQEQIRISSI